MSRDDDAFDGAPGDEVGPLFAEAGPFDDSSEKPAAMEALVAKIVWPRKGRDRAVSIAELSQRTGLKARSVKQIAADLLMKHNVLIGGCRSGEDDGGYFVIETVEDLKTAIGPFQAQIEAMQKRVRKLEALAKERGILQV